MGDFSLRQGELIDLRSMRMAEEGEWEEAWFWKASQGAQALILGHEGFMPAGERRTFRSLNSAVAADESLKEEVRRAGTFGAGDYPLVDEGGSPLAKTAVSAPAYLYGKGKGRGGLSARSERRDGRWRVVFSRALEMGEGRQSFRPGREYRFGVAVFDGTSTNHHLVRDTQVLTLTVREAPREVSGRGDRERPDGDGIL